MQNTRYVNPKHMALMNLALRKIYDSTFDEGHIRTLLLGMRDQLQKFEKECQKQDAPQEIQLGVPYLVDLANSIAHPEMKNQGRIRSHIKSMDSHMAKALAKMPTQKIYAIDEATKTLNIEMPPAIKAVSAFNLTLSFITFLSHYLQADLKKIHDQGADIEICLLSMLHFMQFPHLDDPIQQTDSNSRHAYLAFNTFHGVHNIDAVVLNSDYKNLLDHSFHPGSLNSSPMNIFPVFSSSVSATTSVNFDARSPEVLFAERDYSGKIALKKSSYSH